MQKIFNYKKLIYSFIIIIFTFGIDRASKIYILNLAENGTIIDFYIFSFLNIFLVWNSGIGFGFLSFEANNIYHFITFIIAIINLLLIYLIFTVNDIRRYFILIVLGGSLGNFFDRVYYYQVPDFIDFHIGNFHWFIFNIADIFITIGVICLIIVEIFWKKLIK
tara:strand:+ start:1053 stop:1544 length:492 start_codon:yes stop_codon:yes gene_type:complete